MGNSAAHHLVVLRQAISQASNGGDIQLGSIFSLSRIEEIEASVCANRPVGMLSTAVDAGKRLLMEQDLQAKFGCLSVHDLHETHVAVTGHVGSTEDGRHLMLARSHFVVFHSHWAIDLQHLSLHGIQKFLDFSRDWLEVIQIALLVPGGQGAKQSPATIHQVRTSFVMISRDHEKFLFPAQVAVHGFSVRANANGLEEAQTVQCHCVHGSEQRRLLINAFAKVRHKGARNVEALVHHEGRRCSVPGGESCSRMSHS
mmetsp:Transcript_30855/g.37860  ORF Transcript_30855/g.37860 Transcript_30855/m.37860 type:complete len:257 (+) Transcript_30855:1143-1913(+)